MFYKHHSSSLLWLYLGNSQVSVDRTIGPTLVLQFLAKYQPLINAHWKKKTEKKMILLSAVCFQTDRCLIPE